MIHFQMQQILIGSLVSIPLEDTAQLGNIRMTLQRDLTQRFEPLEISIHVLAALPKARE